MEHDIPLLDTTESFSYINYSSLFIPIDIDLENNCIGKAYINSFATHILDAKYKQANIHHVAFDKHHVSLDQHQDLFNTLFKDKNYFTAPLDSILTRKFTLNWNLELSWCITMLSCPSHTPPNLQKGPRSNGLDWYPLIWGIKWVSPAFIIPKKDRKVQHITDLCSLNKAIVLK